MSKRSEKQYEQMNRSFSKVIDTLQKKETATDRLTTAAPVMYDFLRRLKRHLDNGAMVVPTNAIHAELTELLLSVDGGAA